MALWTKDFTILFVSKLLTSSVFNLLTASIASYSMVVLGVNPALAGLISGIFILSSVIGRLYAGAYLEKVGHRKMLLWSGFALFAASCLYLLPFNAWRLLIIRTVHGAIHGIASNTVTSVVAIGIPRERMGEGLSYFSLSTTASLAIGPFVGLSLLQSGYYMEMFILCAALTLLSFVPLFFMDLKNDPQIKNSGEKKIKEAPFETSESGAKSAWDRFIRLFDMFVERRALAPALVILLLCISSSALTAFEEPYAMSVGLGAYSAYFFLVYAVVMLISRPMLGKIMDKRKLSSVAYPTIVIFALSFVAICIPHAPFLFIAAVLSSLGYSGFFPCCQTACVRNADASRIGIATSTFFSFTDTGLGLGPLVGGLVIGIYGYEGMFLTCAGIAILALIIMIFTSKRKHRND